MVTNRRTLAGLLVGALTCGVVVAGRGTPLAAQAPTRVLEIRTYTTVDGRLDALVKRMREKEGQIFEKVGMKVVGFFVATEAPKSANTFVYILGHASREAARASWARFGMDPEWQELRATSEAAGPIVAKVESIFVNPLDFSPLK
jgi:hypothetical protein